MAESSPNHAAPPIFDNSLYRRNIIRPIAHRLAPLFYHLGFSANGICWTKLLLGLSGAALLCSKSAGICLVGMLLLQLNFLLDAVDGEVARLRGEAGRLSGEYLDKLFDHWPKVAMYFCWGYGAFQLTGSHLPLFCGMVLAGLNIYPRFCAVETLLERLDKAPHVFQKPEFHQAVAQCFVTDRERGKADFFLTVLLHPAMNMLTIGFIIEILMPQVHLLSLNLHTRLVLISAVTIIALGNLLRKGLRNFRLLHFSS